MPKITSKSVAESAEPAVSDDDGKVVSISERRRAQSTAQSSTQPSLAQPSGLLSKLLTPKQLASSPLNLSPDDVFNPSGNSTPPTPPNVSFISSGLDIIRELTDNRSLYTTTADEPGQWFTITRLPEYLSISIERARNHILHGPQPSFLSTFCCCISVGLDTLLYHPSIQQLIDLRRKFDVVQTANINSKEFDEIYHMMVNMSAAPVNVSHVESVNGKLTEEVSMRLSILHKDIGMKKKTDLGALCICVALSAQPFVFKQHALDMRQSIEELFERINVRVGLGSVMLDYLKRNITNKRIQRVLSDE